MLIKKLSTIPPVISTTSYCTTEYTKGPRGCGAGSWRAVASVLMLTSYRLAEETARASAERDVTPGVCHIWGSLRRSRNSVPQLTSHLRTLRTVSIHTGPGTGVTPYNDTLQLLQRRVSFGGQPGIVRYRVTTLLYFALFRLGCSKCK